MASSSRRIESGRGCQNPALARGHRRSRASVQWAVGRTKHTTTRSPLPSKNPPAGRPPTPARASNGISPVSVIGAFLLSACGGQNKHLGPPSPTLGPCRSSPLANGTSWRGTSRRRARCHRWGCACDCWSRELAPAGALACLATRMDPSHPGWAANHLAAVPANFEDLLHLPFWEGRGHPLACGRCCAKPGLRCLADPPIGTPTHIAPALNHTSSPRALTTVGVPPGRMRLPP